MDGLPQHLIARPLPRTSGADGWRGVLLHIHICEAASFEMEELTEARCVAGRGIEGDRYFLGTGTYSPKPDVREVTLFEIETLEALARNDARHRPMGDGSPMPVSGCSLAPCRGDRRPNRIPRVDVAERQY